MSALVVDAHHHFWGAPSLEAYPWMAGERMAPIRHPFGPRELSPLLQAEGVDRTVLVQTRSSLDETREFLAIADAEPFVAGVVGWVDLTDPGVADVIAGLRAGPGGERLVGIRHQVHDEPDAEWLLRPDVVRGLRAVESAGLTYDLLVRPRELPAAIATAKALPGLRLVVDHAAKPEIASGTLEPWAGLMGQFRDLDHVSCKLSGMVTEADWASWTTRDLVPYADVVLDVFGPDRVLLGSDWPVCLLAGTYGHVMRSQLTLVASMSADEHARVVGGTAE